MIVVKELKRLCTNFCPPLPDAGSRRATLLALLTVVLLAWPVAAAERIVEVESKTLQQAQQSQQRIDAMDEQTIELVRRLQQIQRQAESLAVYNDNLEAMISSQQAEMASLDRQIETIQVTQQEIVPLMLRMLETLDGLVARDVPFLLAERKARIEGLQALMARADIALSEKFRRIMEAYQSELEYGRTIETYQGELDLDGVVRNVEYLRIGRIAYVYQTLDRQQGGYWHPQRGRWEELDKSYLHSIRQGIRIAKRQLAPDLIRVPVVVSEVAQ